MKCFKTSLLAAGFLALALPVGAALAQTGPTTNPNPVNPGTGASGVLTNTNLAEFLKGLGHKVEVKTFADGTVKCFLTISRDGWKYVVEVDLSQGKSHIWLTCPLGNPIAANAQLSPAKLLKLLELTHQYGPAHFSFRTSDRRLCLSIAVANQGMTADAFKNVLDNLLKKVKDSYPEWGSVATVTGGGPGTNGNSSTALKGFENKEGRFSVKMPGTPGQKTETRTFSFGSVKVNTFVSTNPTTGTVFRLEYGDLPEEVNRDQTAEQIFQAALATLLGAQGGEVKSELKIDLGGFAAKDVKVAIPGKGELSCRMCLVNGRLYMLVAESKGNDADVDAFLQSFNFTLEQA
jgi:hypothetical protein